MATTYTITPNSASDVEDAGTLTFTVARSGDLLAETLFVSGIASDAVAETSDYIRWLNQTLVFSEGQLAQTITVANINEWAIDPDKTVELLVQRNAIDTI